MSNVKRFPAPGPWITRDLKMCVLASDYDALAAEPAELRHEYQLCHEHRKSNLESLRRAEARVQALEAAAVPVMAWIGRRIQECTQSQTEVPHG